MILLIEKKYVGTAVQPLIVFVVFMMISSSTSPLLYWIFVGLPLAAVAWVLYGSLIAARVAIVFKFDLENHEEIGDLKLIIWWVKTKGNAVDSSAVTIFLVSCVALILISASVIPISILIGQFLIFRYKNFDISEIRASIYGFRHKLSLKVGLRFIFGFDIV